MNKVVNEIHTIVSITDILYSLELEENRNGFIQCPYHNDRHASCKIYHNNNRFYCFSCGATGDVIDLYAEVNSIDCKSAIREICNLYRIPFGNVNDADFSRRVNKRIGEQKLKEAKRNAYKAEWGRLQAEWIRLDAIRRTSNPLSDEYADAVKRIDYVDYLENYYLSKYKQI